MLLTHFLPIIVWIHPHIPTLYIKFFVINFVVIVHSIPFHCFSCHSASISIYRHPSLLTRRKRGADSDIKNIHSESCVEGTSDIINILYLMNLDSDSICTYFYPMLFFERDTHTSFCCVGIYCEEIRHLRCQRQCKSIWVVRMLSRSCLLFPTYNAWVFSSRLRQ